MRKKISAVTPLRFGVRLRRRRRCLSSRTLFVRRRHRAGGYTRVTEAAELAGAFVQQERYLATLGR